MKQSSVSLKNFTGTITRKTNGQVVVRGKGRKTTKRGNVAEGFYSDGVFHPIRASSDYNRKRAGEADWQFKGGHAVKVGGKKRKR
jgi:hypothetical protein